MAVVCSYTSAEGRKCKTKTPTVHCIHHTCSGCAGPKPSRSMSCADCLSNPNAFNNTVGTTPFRALTDYGTGSSPNDPSVDYRAADAPEISQVDYRAGQVDYRTPEEMKSGNSLPLPPLPAGAPAKTAKGKPACWEKKMLLAQAEIHRPTTEHMKHVLSSFGHHGGGLSTSRRPRHALCPVLFVGGSQQITGCHLIVKVDTCPFSSIHPVSDVTTTAMVMGCGYNLTGIISLHTSQCTPIQVLTPVSAAPTDMSCLVKLYGAAVQGDLAHKFNYAEVEFAAEDVFRLYDVDKSGTIDGSELRSLLFALGVKVSDDSVAMAMRLLGIKTPADSCTFDVFHKWWTATYAKSRAARGAMLQGLGKEIAEFLIPELKSLFAEFDVGRPIHGAPRPDPTFSHDPQHIVTHVS
jgi:hypothetical protein